MHTAQHANTMALVSQRRSGVLSIYYLLHCLISTTAAIATNADWEALAKDVSGNLHGAVPLAKPCFSIFNGLSVSVDQAECSAVQQNYLNGTFRTGQYAGFYHSYGDGCISNTTNQCILDLADPSASTAGEQCNNGILSPYYIQVTSAADVQVAYAFSRRTGTPLSIKATGHDYMTRSSLAGSLALWTRNLKNMTYHPAFIPSGNQSASGQSPVHAITLGAGVNGDEAQAFAAANNVTITSPSTPTVAIVGGWSLNGGHSVLTPALGLGADRILELTVVTPDGQLRVCNAAQNADLFWALRGAGGGAFGVVLSATIQAEPSMSVSFALMTLSPTADNQVPFLELLINSTVGWAGDGWGGPMSASSIALVNTRMDLEAATASMANASAFVRANNGTVSIQHFDVFYDFYTEFISPSVGDVGQGDLLDFRVLPKSMHTTDDGRAKLLTYLQKQVEANTSMTFFQTPPFNYDYTNGSNSVHPAWRNSYWDIGASMQFAWNATVEERKLAAETNQKHSLDLVDLAPDGCAYPNEASPWQKDWQNQFWGPNYKRLAAIKKKYDPDELLDCWRCVGFQEENPAFECMAAFDGLV